MSDRAAARSERPVEVVASLMSSAAIFLSLIGLAYRPLRLVPVALVLALVAGAVGGRHSRLAALAAGVGTVALIGGAVIAVVTENPLF